MRIEVEWLGFPLSKGHTHTHTRVHTRSHEHVVFEATILGHFDGTPQGKHVFWVLSAPRLSCAQTPLS